MHSSRINGEGELRGNRLTQVHLEKGPLKWSVSVGQIVEHNEKYPSENLTSCVPPFKVTGTNRDQLAACDFLLALHSIIGLSRAISEINSDFSQNLQISTPQCI